MAHGLQLYNESGDVRLDLSDSCVHYLGSVSKYYGGTSSDKYFDPITCPIPYSGRIICVVVVDKPFNYYPTSITTRSIVSGNVLNLEIGTDGNYKTTITVHFLGI